MTLLHIEVKPMIGKRNCSIFFVLLCIVIALAASAQAQLYQYTDKNGNIVFTDRPPSGSDAKKKQMNDDVYWSAPQREQEQATRGNSSTQSQKESIDKKHASDYGSVTAEMYMTSWCGYCKEAGSYIRSLGVNLVQYDIEAQPDRKAEMKQKSGGSTAIPLIDIGGTIIRGYNPAAIKAAVEKIAGR
jgi:glutaredoxin